MYFLFMYAFAVIVKWKTDSKGTIISIILNCFLSGLEKLSYDEKQLIQLLETKG